MAKWVIGFKKWKQETDDNSEGEKIWAKVHTHLWQRQEVAKNDPACLETPHLQNVHALTGSPAFKDSEFEFDELYSS